MLRRTSVLALIVLSTTAFAEDLAQAVSRVRPPGVSATVTRSSKARTLIVKGRAKTHEEVAEFMRGIASIVSTPKGFGRVTERHRDETIIRVELFASGREEDFPSSSLSDSKTISGLRAEQRRGSLVFTFRLESPRKTSTVY